jgi:hypothetical protein
MELLAPWSLAGLVLVPAVFLWGLLAPRGRPVVVGSLMLWRRALGAGPAGKPSARVRLKDPLLWLDAAAILLIVLACAQPAFRTAAPLEPVATLIIDRTASMWQETATPRVARCSQAKAMTLRVLDAVGDVPVRIIHVPDKSGTLASEMAMAADLRRSPDPWSPVLAKADVWAVATSEAARQSDLPVVVSTDTAPTSQVPANVFVLAPGGASANVGLVRVAARVEGSRWWLLVAARADAGAAGRCKVALLGDGKPLGGKDDFVAPGTSAEAVLAFTGPPPRQLRAALRRSDVQADEAPKDSFTWDDEAYLALEPGVRLRVLLLGKPDLLLRRALAARRDTLVVESPAEGNVPTRDTDLVIASAAALPEDWNGPSVVVSPAQAVGPVRPTEAEAAAEWSVVAEHPLASALYLKPPLIGKVRAYAVSDGARLLAGTPDLPLMVTWEAGGARHLAVLFGLDDRTTDWTRREGFPVFWSHAVDWLVPRERRDANLTTYAPFEPTPARGGLAPGETGFHQDKMGTFGVSFIGTQEAFQSGPGRDDSRAAADSIRRSVEARRRAALAPAWPVLAVAALAAILVRAWVAR